jgi:hypothetical protein
MLICRSARVVEMVASVNVMMPRNVAWGLGKLRLLANRERGAFSA